MSIEQPPSSTPIELREYLVRQIDRIGRLADYIVGGLAIMTIKKLTIVGDNVATTGGGQLYLNGVTGNRIDFNTNGSGAPTFTTRSVGAKLVLYPLVGAAAVDYGLGIETSNLWFSTSTTSTGFKWYGGTTLAATLTGAGRLSLTEHLGVGTTATSIDNIIVGNITGGTTAHGVYVPSVIQSGVTAAAQGFTTSLGTAASSFTCASLGHFVAVQGNIGAGSAVTGQYGFYVDSSLTGATSNYGFYGNIAAATGRYNFYAGGTAANYFAGATSFGSTITGTDAILSSSATGGIGYITGAGGTVTQLTSKGTGVTLSKVCGTITTHAASLAANTAIAFALTNTAISATDNLILNVVVGTTGAYCIGLDSVNDGSCVITIRNLTAGAIAEAISIRFTILNSVNA